MLTLILTVLSISCGILSIIFHVLHLNTIKNLQNLKKNIIKYLFFLEY